MFFFRVHYLATLSGLVLLNVPVQAASDEISNALTFDSDFLSMGSTDRGTEKHIDLSYFAHKGGMAPGQYAVQVKVNGKLVDEGRVLTFKSLPDQPGKLYACVSADDILTWWGITATQKKVDRDVSAAHPEVADDTESTETHCPVGGIMALVPYAQESFDFNRRLLSLTVPQASLGKGAQLRVPAASWDSGLPAWLVNYTLTGVQQWHHGQKQGSHFLGLSGQLNLLGWRFRNDISAYQRQGQSAEWNVSNGYAQRGFAQLGGNEVTLGYTASSGGGVDSVAFWGAKVDSDESMFDPMTIQYTPTVSGIANTPSTVTARQNGQVIFQQNIPQGPYSLSEFNRSGSGDVTVEVRDADGHVSEFVLAQANSSSLLPKGALSYSASTGVATVRSKYVDPRFVQAGGSYGVGENTTLTGGALLSKNYQALALGSGVYLGRFGALTYSMQGSRSQLSAIPGRTGVAMGLAHNVSWSRRFHETSLGMTYTRGQSPNARSYSEMLSLAPLADDEWQQPRSGLRDNLGISLSQSLKQYGNITLNLSRATQWHSDQVTQNIMLGYNTTIADVGLSLAWGMNTVRGQQSERERGHRGKDKTDRSMSLMMSLPLGKWSGSSYLNSGNYSYTQSNGQVSQQSGVSGSALSGDLSYSVSQALTGARGRSLSLGYGGQYGSFSGGYSYQAGNSALSYGVSGAFAAHPHGVTLGKSVSLSGGNALVSIPGASGVPVNGARTDWRGYALVSGLTPYARGNVMVDTSQLPGDVELDSSSRHVVPVRGALVAATFNSQQGYRVLLTLTHQGEPLLFGTSVALQSDASAQPPITGIVAEAGQVYLSGMPAAGSLVARWGDEPDEQCTANYHIPEGTDITRLALLASSCQS
ncbi:outer membrane usher protein [Providencia alcalifaciens]|uniref:Outer membrane usher protein n=1 Tax=Providencia alcalifaciens TaxID=126385 RepID=A0A4V2V318_9GAMM|nr:MULTISPECIES: fimbria/pilus outer membrane usher protein [Providencia]MBC5792265.1 fimbrial biogenesis outer membrane usher protein [Providencia sp. JUb39]TCT28170.1 outer membrane usher protein [Providencia alcalifaciens]